MAVNVAPWIKELCTTSGTGNLVLSDKIDNYIRFNAALSNGDQVYYAILDSNGNRETGIGTFDGLNTITRDTVTATLTNGAYVENPANGLNLNGS